MQRYKNKLAEVSLIVLSIIGLADAILLTIKHYHDLNLPCNVTHGCEIVLTSKYAVVFHLPVAAYGAAFYFVFLLATLYAFGDLLHRRWLFWLSGIGVISTLYLIGIEAFKLHAWCQYCLLSSVVAFLLFIISGVAVWQSRHDTKEGTNGSKA